MTISTDENFLFPAEERSALLLGRKNIIRLRNSKVAILGLGGVGGFCAEALCRSHVGSLLILDKDVVSPSNLNRQIISANSNIGCSKTDLMESRLLSINPKLNIIKKEELISKDSDLSFLKGMDYVVDCVDSAGAKINIACYCYQENIPLLTCTGTARKLDPSKLEFIDLYQSKNDKLCKVLRHELRKHNVSKLDILYSSEMAQGVPPSIFKGEKRLGSLIFVPATAGLMLAHFVINKLTSKMSEEELLEENKFYSNTANKSDDIV